MACERTPLFPDYPHFLHGGDYNPDQWLHRPDILDEDMRLAQLAGCNAFSVGIFAWTALEPEPGVYTMDWLAETLDRLEANGRKAFLATPSGSKPAWLAQAHPEVCRVSSQGLRDPWRSRHNHCPTSPVYRERVAAIDTELARRFGAHPAVLGWHLSNEYNGACHCELCLAAFRDWLKQRYGDLETLNRAWWSAFWNHTITDWDQITAVDSSVDTLQLDWLRFVTHQTCDFMRHELASVRAHSSLPATTNLMGFFPTLDYWRLCEQLDFVSNDAYPLLHEQADMGREVDQFAMVHDLMRCMGGGRPFIQMEASPGPTNWMARPKLKRPGMHRLEMLLAIAHGADGTMYFQWRKSRGCHEKFHGAVVDHVGTEHTRMFREIATYGAELDKLEPVLGTGTAARVALVADWEARWALERSCGPGHKEQDHIKDYLGTCRDWHAAFSHLGVAVDICERRSDFGGYDILVLPQLFLIDDDTAQRLRAFVAGGGTLVATQLTGIVDATNRCHLGGWPGPDLRDLFGVWAEEIDVLYPEDLQSIALVPDNDLGLAGTFTVTDYADRIHTQGAEVLASYTHQFYAQQPALTRNRHGEGSAWYLAARTEPAFLAALANALVGQTGISRATTAPLPEGVHAARRCDTQHEYLFLLNFARHARTVTLDRAGRDLLSGKQTGTQLRLDGYGALVIERPLG